MTYAQGLTEKRRNLFKKKKQTEKFNVLELFEDLFDFY